MADENDKQKEPDYKMSPDTEAGLKKALSSGGVLGDSADALFGGIKSAAESTGRVEQLKQKQAEKLAQGESSASRAFADTTAKQFEAMKAARGEMPKRDIEEHTMQGLLGLGALLPMAGAMLGNKGLASGTGAMQAMAGLFKGYQEGNKERIAFEQKRYDDQMKQWENHARQLESDFRNAVEIAKTNMQAGHDAAKLAAIKAGAPMIAAMVDQQGALKTLEVIEKTVTQTMSYDAAIKKAKILQEGRVDVAREKKYDEIKGQAQQLSGIIGEDINKLGVPEIKQASNTTQSSKEIKEFADLIKQNPWAVGVLGKTYNFLDKYIPSRYKTGQEIYNPAAIDSAASENKAIFAGVPEDKIAMARLIQKKALDIVNARTLAVNNKFLVGEFNSQKSVLDVGNLSPQSAYKVYDRLAYDDLQRLERIMPQETLDKLHRYAGTKGAAQPQTTVQPKDEKPYTINEIESLAKKYSKTTDQIKQNLKAKGYSIEGE
jgi:hypothetical protein